MSAPNYDTVVLDIEGTTTPITFVKDILFPYVTNGLDSFLDQTWNLTELKEQVQLLREQAAKDVAEGLSGAVLIPEETSSNTDDVKRAISQNIRWQVAADRKIGALKSFQGYMWQGGFESGEIRSIIYDDVVPALNRWRDAGAKIYIYSSGSVPAQKLLFGYSDKGDLLQYFSGYYDTAVGLKIESQSYRNIAKDIGKESDPSTILFVSDNVKETAAAQQAGFLVAVSDRPGNAPLTEEDRVRFPVVTSFAQIFEHEAFRA